VFNFVFQAVAGIFIGLGSWMFRKYINYGHGAVNLDTAWTPSLILIAVGILSALLAVIGCVATFKDQKCVLAIVCIHNASF